MSARRSSKAKPDPNNNTQTNPNDTNHKPQTTTNHNNNKPRNQKKQLNRVNAIVASRVASAFTTYRQYDKPRQRLMRKQLERIAALEGLNENVFEIVSKSLEQ